MNKIIFTTNYKIKSVDRRLSKYVDKDSIILDVSCGNDIDVLRVTEITTIGRGLYLGEKVPMSEALTYVIKF